MAKGGNQERKLGRSAPRQGGDTGGVSRNPHADPPHNVHAQQRDHVHESKTATQTQPNAPPANIATGNGNRYATVATSDARSAAYTKHLQLTL